MVETTDTLAQVTALLARAVRAEAQVARVRALHAGSHYCTSKPTHAWTTWYGPTQKCPTLRALDDVEVTSNSPDRLQVQVEAASGVGSGAASSLPTRPSLNDPAWRAALLGEGETSDG